MLTNHCRHSKTFTHICIVMESSCKPWKQCVLLSGAVPHSLVFQPQVQSYHQKEDTAHVEHRRKQRKHVFSSVHYTKKKHMYTCDFSFDVQTVAHAMFTPSSCATPQEGRKKPDTTTSAGLYHSLPIGHQCWRPVLPPTPLHSSMDSWVAPIILIEKELPLPQLAIH